MCGGVVVYVVLPDGVWRWVVVCGGMLWCIVVYCGVLVLWCMEGGHVWGYAKN